MPSCFKVNVGLAIEKIHVTAIAFVYLKYKQISTGISNRSFMQCHRVYNPDRLAHN